MNEKQTYAIFSAQYLPHTGGAEWFTARLGKELVSQGHSVIIVASQIEGAPIHETQDDGVEVYRLPVYSLLQGRLPILHKTQEYKQLMNVLKARSVTRVLVNTRFYRHSLEGVRFAREIGVPVVVLDHGSAHIVLGNVLADAAIERYEHAITKRIMAYDPIFAGISQASIGWLEHFGIHTPYVIPNAIDAQAYRESASARDFKAELGVKKHEVLVSFAGRLTPEKGALVLAKAAQMLGDGYVIAMAGEGPVRHDIEKLNAANVILLGNLAQPDLSALLRDTDIFCLPTRSEGFCTSLLEATAQGCIPVMPHVGGTDELMGADPVELGVLLENTNPETVAAGIEKAVQQLNDATTQKAARTVEACSWSKTAAALDAAFQ